MFLYAPLTATAYHKVKYKLLDIFLLIMWQVFLLFFVLLSKYHAECFPLSQVCFDSYVCCIQTDQVLEWAPIGLA